MLLFARGFGLGRAALDFDPLDGLEPLNLSADKVLVPPRSCVRAIGGEALEAPQIELPRLFDMRESDMMMT
jgi:hypothetical protein